MNRFRNLWLMFLGLGAASLLIVSSGLSQEAAPKMRMVPGLSFEYFSRTLGWDPDPTTSEDRYSSPIRSLLGLLHLDYEIQKGSLVGVLFGYSLTNFNGLVFRQIPFSIDYQAGSIGGFLVGAEIDQKFITSGYFEMKAMAQFVIYLGSTKNLQVTTLNTDGKLNAKPDDWMRAQIGPVFSYLGFEDFSPFLSVTYNKLWGKFTMTETIGDLKGSEEKKISAKSMVGISLGTRYESSPNFSLRAEGTLLPFKKGINKGWGFDYGGSLYATFSF
jgi:hypothetical protein